MIDFDESKARYESAHAHRLACSERLARERKAADFRRVCVRWADALAESADEARRSTVAYATPAPVVSVTDTASQR